MNEKRWFSQREDDDDEGQLPIASIIPDQESKSTKVAYFHFNNTGKTHTHTHTKIKL